MIFLKKIKKKLIGLKKNAVSKKNTFYWSGLCKRSRSRYLRLEVKRPKFDNTQQGGSGGVVGAVTKMPLTSAETTKRPYILFRT